MDGFTCPLCGRFYLTPGGLYSHARRVLQHLVAAGIVKEARVIGGIVYTVGQDAALGAVAALSLVKKHYPGFNCSDIAKKRIGKARKRKRSDPPANSLLSVPGELLSQAGKVLREMLSKEKGTEAHLPLREILDAIGLPSASHYARICAPLLLSIAPPPWQGKGVRRGYRGLTIVFSRL